MKKASLILVLMAMSLFSFAQTIEHTYHFNQPIVTNTTANYQQINFEGCIPSGETGNPMLPWQSVSLMLPQGYEAVDIDFVFNDFVEMDGTYNLMPAQLPRPISETRVIPFSKNEEIYRSNVVFPAEAEKNVNNQILNGVGFVFSGFTPMQYVPATGKVSYAKTVTVTVTLQASRADNSRKLWLTAENKAAVQRLAQNDKLNTYINRGREIPGYDMLLITTAEWVEPLTEYVALYNDKGIRTHVATLEDIYAQMDGRDNQEKIRNYIIQEYENDGIIMVSLGGDVSIVPYRSLWCFAQEGYEDQLPSDMYYAALDGTLNDDNDDKWGEVGEDDLLPEIGIGRLPFNNQEQLDIILHKTFSYLEEPVLGEFTSPILGAEHLGDGYYGSDDMERLIGECSDYDYTTIGYPENYDFKKYYATPSLNWSASDFKNLIGTGGQYVHHVGHANADYVAGWTGSTMGANFFAGNDGINHNFMIFHSHGCICGDFPSSCVLEKMVTIPTGFVVTVGNSRYGWYSPWGDGMAAHIHRELLDAYCNDHIGIIGMALREAKIATAPWVTEWGESGCFRWNIYCLNILGDVALMPWFEEPFIPEVYYAPGIRQGCSTAVTVKHRNEPLEGFRCSYFKDGELIGFGITDSDGYAEIVFTDPNEPIGDIDLIVTGMSALTRHLPVKGLNDEPFLYTRLYNFIDNGNENGIAEYGEDFGLFAEVINPSLQDVSGIDIDLTCDSEYITINAGHVHKDNIMHTNGYILPTDAFSFSISDDVPDQTRVIFYVTCSADGNEWPTEFPLYISAPKLQFTDIVIDDIQGNNNGIIEQGETIILFVKGFNKGHCLAPNAYLNATCDSGDITILDSNVLIGDIDANGAFSTSITFVSDEDIVGGSIYQIHFNLITGAYSTPNDYTFSVGQAVETFESGDFSFLDWTHEGDLPWTVTDEEAYNGQFSARSGAIDDDEVSRLIVYADTYIDSQISFYYKTSSERNKDFLAFFVDGRMKERWSGENEWTLARYDLAAGSHVFEWLYDKNQNGVAGADCVWIDDVTFPATSIITEVEAFVSEKKNVIYPNPSHGQFTLILSDSNSNITIFNALGQMVMQCNGVSGEQRINLQDKGLYFVQIQNENGVEVMKMIVE